MEQFGLTTTKDDITSFHILWRTCKSLLSLYLQSHCATFKPLFHIFLLLLLFSGLVQSAVGWEAFPSPGGAGRIGSTAAPKFASADRKSEMPTPWLLRPGQKQPQSRSNDSHYVWVLKHENVIRQTGDDRLRASHSCRPGDGIAEPRRGAGVGPGLAEHPKNRGESFKHGFERPD